MFEDSNPRSSRKHAVEGNFRRVKDLPLVAVAVVALTIFLSFDLWSARVRAGVAGLSSSSQSASQSMGSAFPVWVSPSLIRVGKTDTPGSASSITLSGARGETVDAQIIVHAPASGLTHVNVSASALTGPGGASIAASNVTLYREYYITVTGTSNYGGGSNPPLGSGTYAEPLIPFNDPETGLALCGTEAAIKGCNATVNAGQNQPY